MLKTSNLNYQDLVGFSREQNPIYTNWRSDLLSYAETYLNPQVLQEITIATNFPFSQTVGFEAIQDVSSENQDRTFKNATSYLTRLTEATTAEEALELLQIGPFAISNRSLDSPQGSLELALIELAPNDLFWKTIDPNQENDALLVRLFKAVENAKIEMFANTKTSLVEHGLAQSVMREDKMSKLWIRKEDVLAFTQSVLRNFLADSPQQPLPHAKIYGSEHKIRDEVTDAEIFSFLQEHQNIFGIDGGTLIPSDILKTFLDMCNIPPDKTSEILSVAKTTGVTNTMLWDRFEVNYQWSLRQRGFHYYSGLGWVHATESATLTTTTFSLRDIRITNFVLGNQTHLDDWSNDSQIVLEGEPVNTDLTSTHLLDFILQMGDSQEAFSLANHLAGDDLLQLMRQRNPEWKDQIDTLGDLKLANTAIGKFIGDFLAYSSLTERNKNNDNAATFLALFNDADAPMESIILKCLDENPNPRAALIFLLYFFTENPAVDQPESVFSSVELFSALQKIVQNIFSNLSTTDGYSYGNTIVIGLSTYMNTWVDFERKDIPHILERLQTFSDAEFTSEIHKMTHDSPLTATDLTRIESNFAVSRSQSPVLAPAAELKHGRFAKSASPLIDRDQLLKRLEMQSTKDAIATLNYDVNHGLALQDLLTHKFSPAQSDDLKRALKKVMDPDLLIRFVQALPSKHEGYTTYSYQLGITEDWNLDLLSPQQVASLILSCNGTEEENTLLWRNLFAQKPHLGADTLEKLIIAYNEKPTNIDPLIRTIRPAVPMIAGLPYEESQRLLVTYNDVLTAFVPELAVLNDPYTFYQRVWLQFKTLDVSERKDIFYLSVVDPLIQHRQVFGYNEFSEIVPDDIQALLEPHQLHYLTWLLSHDQNTTLSHADLQMVLVDMAHATQRMGLMTEQLNRLGPFVLADSSMPTEIKMAFVNNLTITTQEFWLFIEKITAKFVDTTVVKQAVDFLISQNAKVPFAFYLYLLRENQVDDFDWSTTDIPDNAVRYLDGLSLRTIPGFPSPERQPALSRL